MPVEKIEKTITPTADASFPLYSHIIQDLQVCCGDYRNKLRICGLAQAVVQTSADVNARDNIAHT